MLVLSSLQSPPRDDTGVTRPGDCKVETDVKVFSICVGMFVDNAGNIIVLLFNLQNRLANHHRSVGGCLGLLAQS